MAGWSENTHWRDTARHARFFMVDARAAFPLLLFLLHIRYWTFIVAVVCMTFFAMLERFGFSIEVFGRVCRGFIAGPYKPAEPWWKR